MVSGVPGQHVPAPAMPANQAACKQRGAIHFAVYLPLILQPAQTRQGQ